MNEQFSEGAPVGRLYDALHPLSGQAHRALDNKTKTVWNDERWYVFATRADPLHEISPHTTIGVRGQRVKLSVIECGMRVAQRERVRTRITDWSGIGNRTSKQTN